MKKQLFIIGITIVVILGLSGCTETDEDDPVKIQDNVGYVENPFLWTIESETPSYLFGTMHLADERLLTLPDVVMEAIEDSDILYTEIRLDSVTDSLQIAPSLLPEGQQLSDILPQDVYDRLGSYLSSKNIPILVFENFQIWAVATSILLLDDMENLFLNQPLDYYLWNLALSKGKGVRGLETLEEHFEFSSCLTEEEQVELLVETLDQLGELEDTYENIYSVLLEPYMAGSPEDLQALDLLFVEEKSQVSEKLDESLVTERNHIMANRINELISSNPDTQYFFAIGTAHYYGEEGILELLETEGYTITRATFSECDECSESQTMMDGRCYYPYIKTVFEDGSTECSTGSSFFSSGQYEEAIEMFTEAVALNPQDVYSWESIGESQFLLQNYEEALEAFNTAIELDPLMEFAWLNKGVTLIFLNRNEESLEAFDNAIDVNSQDAYAWYFKGVSLQNLGRIDESEEALQQAYELDPTLEYL